jgi:Cutinase
MAYMSDTPPPEDMQPPKWKRQLGKLGGGRYNGACSANIVLFARGTLEVGSMGSVGPKLSRQLPKASWTVVGVPYSADVAGDNCVGLPGGMIAKSMLESAAAKCPRSNLFTAGYSQGAMVARIAVAYARPDVKARVKVRFALPRRLSGGGLIANRAFSPSATRSTAPRSRATTGRSRSSAARPTPSAAASSRSARATWRTSREPIRRRARPGSRAWGGDRGLVVEVQWWREGSNL